MQNLYFIAIVPPEEICSQVTYFKEDFAVRYQSRAALKVIPHITLKVPFKADGKSHSLLMKWYDELKISVAPFEIELNGFGCFAKREKPVVFIRPVINEQLIQLQKEILQNFFETFSNFQPEKFESDFKPHLTIAYRDLKPDLFKKAWQEYSAREYLGQFCVSSFYLLQHNFKYWVKVAEKKL